MANQALEGIKVLDFGWALVGSITSKQLADHGAQVIRIESMSRVDLPRTNRMIARCKANNPDDKPWFLHLNTSKYSMCLNLKCESSHIIVEKLIKWADVINSNFIPGTLEKMGFGYEKAKSINPGIIMVAGSAYGQTGPMARQWGVDGTGGALSGYLDLTGWPDRPPVGPNAPYGDLILPFLIATSIIGALEYRKKTGKGQYIDAGMVEVCTHQLTPALLDLQANKHLQTRNGNRIPNAAPHGVFPCLGDDKWCAIAVFTEEEWASCCDATGMPQLKEDPRFSSLASRKENEDLLEKIIAAWSIQRMATEVMRTLQSAGVPAGVVQTMEDVTNDRQLKERDFMIRMKHPVIGECNHPTPPYKLSKTKARIKTSPCMGEHTEFVCTNILGMSDDEFIKFWQERIFR